MSFGSMDNAARGVAKAISRESNDAEKINTPMASKMKLASGEVKAIVNAYREYWTEQEQSLLIHSFS